MAFGQYPRAFLAPITVPFFIICLLALQAPSPAAANPQAGRRAEPASDLVWPLPPDPPRIRYVGSLHSSSDFKKKSRRWTRFFLGPDKETGISLRKPYGVTTDSEGRVYVTDTGLGVVVMFDGDKQEVRQLGASGRVRLHTPIGIVFDDRGRLFVSDADLDQVFRFDSNGEVELALGGKEGLSNPTGLAFDPDRQRLYVADSHQHQIFLYSPDGEFLTRWGSRGSGPGEFNFPTNLTVDSDGNLYVVDTGNFRVQVLSPDGEHLQEFGKAGDGFGSFHRPKGIALDSDGHIYVVDAAFNNFQIFNSESQVLLFVGTLGKGPGDFWLPAGIHIDDSDQIYIVDQVNARVQIFQYLTQKAAPPGDDEGAAQASTKDFFQSKTLSSKGVIPLVSPAARLEKK